MTNPHASFESREKRHAAGAPAAVDPPASVTSVTCRPTGIGAVAHLAGASAGGVASAHPVRVLDQLDHRFRRVRQAVVQVVSCSTHATVLCISQRGVAYALPAYKVPASSRSARGVMFPQLLPIGEGECPTIDIDLILRDAD